jgi:hypothetical protein
MNCGQLATYPQDKVVHNSIHNFIHRYYPSYPQLYPQASLRSNATNCLNPFASALFIHSLEELSTVSVDNRTGLWKLSGELSTGWRCVVDRLWTEYTFNAYFVLQSPFPGGRGFREYRVTAYF